MNATLSHLSDPELLAHVQAGERNAFAELVRRHQSLVCAQAYAVCGDFSRSEDVAQEAFIAAWRQLGEVRDGGKFKSWLCTIARRLALRMAEKGRRPADAYAASLETAADPHDPAPSPHEAAASREESALVWSALETIPAGYREALVLFYREGRSVAAVAEALEISEDAAKQRLSRGREMLRDQLASVVEGTLARTRPGPAFTIAVLAALPVFATSAKAATGGASAAKTGALAKSAGVAGLFNAVLGFIGMLLGMYFGYRLDRDSARSAQERRIVTRYYRLIVICMMMVVLAALLLILFGWPVLQFHVSLMTRLGWPELRFHPTLCAGLLVAFGVIYLGVGAALTVWLRLSLRKIGNDKTLASHPVPLRTPLFEYRSRLGLFGWPLIHIRLRGGLERGPVKAWFAAGDAAIGLVFAFGAVAIAPVSFGGFALGLFTLGGGAIGLVPFGGFSFGLYSLGGLAVGLQAFGGCAIAWTAAEGGLAIARDFALGAAGLAQHTNDAIAEAFIHDSTFFQVARTAMRYVQWLNLLWLLPLVLWLRQRRTMRSTMMRVAH